MTQTRIWRFGWLAAAAPGKEHKFKLGASCVSLCLHLLRSRVNSYWDSLRWPQRAAPRRRQTSCFLFCGGLVMPESFPSPPDSDRDCRRNLFAVHAVLTACRLYADPSLFPWLVSFLVLFLASDHFNAIGVINVVMITMITTAPKIAELITGWSM